MPGGCKRALFLAVLVVAAAFIPASSHPATKGQGGLPPTPEATAKQSEGTVTIEGCLAQTSEGFELTDEAADQVYRLNAPESQLHPYIGAEVRIKGWTGDEDQDAIDFQMSRIELVRRPVKRLPVLGSAKWRSYRSRKFGVVMQYPASFEGAEHSEISDSGFGHWNFVNPNGIVNLQVVGIPRAVYPNTMFAGGSFSLSVSDEISNASACGVFREWVPYSLRSRSIHGLKYTEALDGDAAAGTSYGYHYFHTFQHGRCYELEIEFAEGNPGNLAAPYMVDFVNEEALVIVLLEKVSFFPPASKRAHPKNAHQGAPVVTSFEITPGTKSMFSPLVPMKISWSVAGADYVEIIFACPQAVYVNPQPGDAGQMVDCTPGDAGHNVTSEGYAAVEFDNLSKTTASMVFTLQPFSNGIGNPEWSKTITLVLGPSR